MADAVVVSIAKAVESRIGAATLSQEFQLARSYADWDLQLTNLDSLESRDSDKILVDVCSHTTEQTAELLTRSSLKLVCPIDIAVRRKLGSDKQDDDDGRISVTEIDALMLLVEEIHALFAPQRLVDFSYAAWESTRILVAPDRTHLRTLRQFTGIIRVSFTAALKLA